MRSDDGLGDAQTEPRSAFFVSAGFVHSVEKVWRLCNSLPVLEKGRIAERGPFDKVALSPRTALAWALVKQLQTRSISLMSDKLAGHSDDRCQPMAQNPLTLDRLR